MARKNHVQPSVPPLSVASNRFSSYINQTIATATLRPNWYGLLEHYSHPQPLSESFLHRSISPFLVSLQYTVKQQPGNVQSNIVLQGSMIGDNSLCRLRVLDQPVSTPGALECNIVFFSAVLLLGDRQQRLSFFFFFFFPGCLSAFVKSQEGVRFALEREGERLLFLEGVREYTSKVTPRQKKILANFFDEEVRHEFVVVAVVSFSWRFIILYWMSGCVKLRYRAVQSSGCRYGLCLFLRRHSVVYH